MKKNLLRLALLIFAIKLNAQQNTNYQLQLISGIFTPEANLESFVKNNQVQKLKTYNGSYFTYLQFLQLPSTEQKEELKNAGIELMLYLPNYTYMASIKTTANLSILYNYNVRSIIEPTVKMKMQPQLFTGTYPDYAITEKGEMKMNVLYYSCLNDFAVRKTIEEKYTVLKQNNDADRIVVIVPMAELLNFVALPFVCYVEPIDAPAVPDNNGGRTNHRSNAISTDDPLGRKYNGSGVNVCLQDDGIIGPHIDYTGRIANQFMSFNNGNHGDHTGGIVMGGGNLNPLGKGMGWGSTLFVYEASPNYMGFDSISIHYSSYGIVITSTSYSDGCNQGYTTFTQQLDQQIRQLPYLMHVFSAGNMGTSDCNYGAGAGWGNITGGHKMGKNSIAVGNLDSIDALNSSSSRGPGTDGRLKPEVCGVGTNVMSTIDANSYANFTGTSMSCPGTSGVLSQLYQAYKQLNGNQNPNSALMKGILMNSADDLGNPGPDFRFGYGRINALRAVKYIEQNTFLNGTVSNSGTNTHNITVPANTEQVRIMLYWHDYEAAPNASPALVNNLRMVVTDPSSTNFNPWILDPTPNVTNLNANAVRGIDNLNNHEQVTIDNPQAGNYTITVTGTNVPQGPQDYYIAYEFVTNAITVTYPIGGEGLRPNENQSVKWDAFGTTGTFTIELTADNGNTWSTLSSTVSGAARSFAWTTPANVTSGQCRIRISRNSVTDQSDANFSIIDIPQNIQVVWACPDSVRLTWNTVANATGYEISKLGTMYMDSIGTSTTNSFVVTNVPANNTYWFSVKALGPLNAEGRRANAIQKTPGTFNCALAIDASTNTFVSPNGTYQTCQSGLGTTVISITLQNTGTGTLTNIPVRYKINNNPVVNETYNGTLAPNATVNYNFTTTANFASAGTYNIDAWASYGGDGNPYNDTASSQVIVINGTAVNLPWIEDFETFPLCGSASDCELTNCTLASGWVNVTNGAGAGDDIDWRTFQGDTPSANTGPSVDFIPGTASGNYLYLEASTCFNKEAEVITPCINLVNATAPLFTFHYHMYGTNMGVLYVDLLSNGIWINDVVPAVSGNLGNTWQTGTVSLSPYIGQVINIRFRGVTGTGFLSDMALDGMSVQNAVGMNEYANNANIFAYPNPTNGIFYVNANNTSNGTALINVTNVLGEVVYNSSFESTIGKINTTIDLSANAAGVYYLTVIDAAGNKFVTKVNKQ